MANYCGQCGRELKEGEVCNCTQNVQEAGNTADSIEYSVMQGTGYTDKINLTGNTNISIFMANLKRILKNPVETASSLVAVKDTSILKGIWILNIAILFLLVLFINWKVIDLVQETLLLRNIAYEYTDLEGISFSGILKIVLGYIAIYLIFTALMAFVTRLFDKVRKFTFGQACIITGISGLYGMIGLVSNTFILMAIISKIIKNIEEPKEVEALVAALIIIIGVITLFCSLLSFHIYTESMSSMSVRWTVAYTIICICRVIVVAILMYFLSELMI